jgi:hypothetical protein
MMLKDTGRDGGARNLEPHSFMLGPATAHRGATPNPGPRPRTLQLRPATADRPPRSLRQMAAEGRGRIQSFLPRTGTGMYVCGATMMS